MPDRECARGAVAGIRSGNTNIEHMFLRVKPLTRIRVSGRWQSGVRLRLSVCNRVDIESMSEDRVQRRPENLNS